MSHTSLDIQSELTYASISSSRRENNISSHGNYLLFSKCRCPVVYDLASEKVASTFLFGHTEDVNGQQFVQQSPQIPSENDTSYLISTSHDRTAIIWEIHKNDSGTIENKILHHFKSPDDCPFMARCCIQQDGCFKSITTTLNCSIFLWINDKLVQTLRTKWCCFDAKVYSIPINPQLELTFVFLAGSDNKIHVFQLLGASLEPLFELKGHTDWVKCLDLVDLAGRQQEFLLASASQDSFVRVWHIKLVDYEVDSRQVRTVVSRTLSVPSPETDVCLRFTATLETVLSGHDAMVHGLCWFKKQSDMSLRLLTCSADKTIVLWGSCVAPVSSDQSGQPQKFNRYDQCPASATVWKELQRFGETGETNLPFLGLCLSNQESTFYAVSLRGAIHSWKEEDGIWTSGEAIKGHFEPVTDLSWERSGAYLLSVSMDKTCRLHAVTSDDNHWHEIARPQVHGHQLNCVASINFTRFASGADEKTIRTFGATKFFLKNFESLTKVTLPKEIGDLEEYPAHAQLPALGLSNRGAQSLLDETSEGGDGATAGSSSDNWYGVSKLVEQLAQLDHLSDPPTEEISLQYTLWWETNKLFGHSNELYAIAVDSSGSFMASASKSNRADSASILIWECSRFMKSATLEHHKLTITRLRFSPNDRYLLSVSRDRTWCISERTEQMRPAYKKLFGTVKSTSLHERIIWDCCWTWDSEHFMTVSRDKKAILWSVEEVRSRAAAPSSGEIQPAINCVLSKVFGQSVQAVDSPGRQCNMAGPKTYLFALGFEDGSLELHSVSSEQLQWQALKSFSLHHQTAIRRLAFKPLRDPDDDVLLASAGDDCIVKLTRLFV